MKKIIFTTILIFLVFSLSACTNDQNTISEANLTNRESEILSTTSDVSFVYDFNVESSYKQLSVWVEKYEFGKLVGKKINHITSEIKDDGTIIFATSKTLNNQNQSVFILGINGRESNRTIINDELEGVCTWRGPHIVNNPFKNNIVLASFICYKNGNHMNSLTDDFYRDVNNHIKEIKDYKVVYLLRAKFTK
ncbi:hypothetical protein ACFVRR_03440 [Gottfriedia sp. NPDC057948]|uniref:hypothetical protein n=1 Tax=Gottfriedia sp. NPDC057948 TaxID=3346287 RepID=UPI0036D7C2B5